MRSPWQQMQLKIKTECDGTHCPRADLTQTSHFIDEETEGLSGEVICLRFRGEGQPDLFF